MAKNIVIYKDEGVGEFGLKCLAEFFKGEDVWFASADAVIDGRVLGMADLFVMPGGADLPYCKKLNGAGNDNIRAYVEEGGTYLGICAGAYYACQKIEFNTGQEDEICEKRELSLVPATAIGSITELAKPYDNTLESAAVIALDGKNVLYHGGPHFKLREHADILLRYPLPYEAPAMIRTQFGDGTVLLSGVHFEIGPEQLKNHPAEAQRGKELAAQFNSVPDWKNLLFSTEENI